MIKLENDCVGCGLPCLGSQCKYREVPHFYCDECGDNADLYHFDGEQLCETCIINRLKKVEYM
jgi:hypothetical protein